MLEAPEVVVVKFVAETPPDFEDEVANIVSSVSGKSDYSITIYGNLGGFAAGGSWSDENDGLPKWNGYKTKADLALARANEIKDLLVKKGLDPTKIKTELGTIGSGVSADYSITTIK